MSQTATILFLTKLVFISLRHYPRPFTLQLPRLVLLFLDLSFKLLDAVLDLSVVFVELRLLNDLLIEE